MALMMFSYSKENGADRFLLLFLWYYLLYICDYNIKQQENWALYSEMPAFFENKGSH